MNIYSRQFTEFFKLLMGEKTLMEHYAKMVIFKMEGWRLADLEEMTPNEFNNFWLLLQHQKRSDAEQQQ